MRRTVLVVLCVLVPSPLVGQTPEQKQATVKYLRQLQTPDGGFQSSAKQALSSLRATSAAVRALKYLDATPTDKETCRKFVQQCFDKATGGFADRPAGKPDVFGTAVGIMALVELTMPLEPYEDAVRKYLDENAKTFEDIRIAAAGLETLGKPALRVDVWRDQIRKLANPDGTFGKGDAAVRDTGGSVALLLRLGGKLDSPEPALKLLKNGQRKDGGYAKPDADSADLETTYRVVRSLVMLNDKPADVERLRAFIARCRNDDGGYGQAPGKPSDVGGTYFAAILLHWLDQK